MMQDPMFSLIVYSVIGAWGVGLTMGFVIAKVFKD